MLRVLVAVGLLVVLVAVLGDGSDSWSRLTGITGWGEVEMRAAPLAAFDGGVTPLPRAGDRVNASGTEAAGATAEWEPLALPAPLPIGWLQRGRQLHARNCAACHGADGRGAAVKSLRRPPRYDAPRLLQEDDLRLFDVLTHGSGTMGSFAQRLTPQDRWAVIAYVRALQHATAPAHRL